MTQRNISLAIFDLDGTLIDSIGDIHRAVNEMLIELDEAPLPAPDVRRMVGDGAGVLIDRVLAARPDARITPADALARYLTCYEADPLGLTTLYPGVPETLALLQDRGIRLALSTNKPERPSRAILEHFGLADRFERIVGGDSLPWRKPDRRMLDTIVEALGETTDASLMIGDSEVDAATAVAAGMGFILMSYGYRRGPVESIQCRAAFDDFTALAGLFA